MPSLAALYTYAGRAAKPALGTQGVDQGFSSPQFAIRPQGSETVFLVQEHRWTFTSCCESMPIMAGLEAQAGRSLRSSSPDIPPLSDHISLRALCTQTSGGSLAYGGVGYRQYLWSTHKHETVFWGSGRAVDLVPESIPAVISEFRRSAASRALLMSPISSRLSFRLDRITGGGSVSP